MYNLDVEATAMERLDMELFNFKGFDLNEDVYTIMQSAEVKSYLPISPIHLDALPGELLYKIIAFAVASETPVFFWLLHDSSWKCLFRRTEREGGHTDSSQSTDAFIHHVSLPEDQKRHYVDWRIVTSTSHRIRSYGKPAFFHAKTFVISPTMLQVLTDQKPQSSTFDLAIDHIRHIMVPVSGLMNGMDYVILPKCHLFRCLKTLMIRVPDKIRQIMDGHTNDGLWPREAPKEFLEVLGGLGLRVDEVKVKIEVVAKENKIPSHTKIMQRRVYPMLRNLIQLRREHGDSLFE